MTSKFVLVHSKEGLEDARARVAAARKPAATEPFEPGRIRSGRLIFDDSAGLERFSFLGDLARPRDEDAFSGDRKAATEAERRRARPRKTVIVGIWSLDAWLGSLSQLIEGLNRVQQTFAFYEVAASVPAGLISRQERAIPSLEKALKKNPNKATREALQRIKQSLRDNLFANDFFGLADSIRSDLGLDYIVGITPSMVAGQDPDGSFYTDHFSTCEERTVLASSYDLQSFSDSSGLSFEAFLATIVISELLAAICPKLEFHDDRGCLFDYNNDRISLIKDVSDPMIEPSCMKLVRPQYRDAAKSFVDFIRSIRGAKP